MFGLNLSFKSLKRGKGENYLYLLEISSSYAKLVMYRDIRICGNSFE
jgi:hypothetical protein